MTDDRKPPLPIGTIVKPFGRISAVGWIGERYYWFVKDGDVSMIPADMVEASPSPAASALTRSA